MNQSGLPGRGLAGELDARESATESIEGERAGRLGAVEGHDGDLVGVLQHACLIGTRARPKVQDGATSVR